MARTAEVVYVGDAASLIRASQEAARATEAASAQMAAANTKVGGSYLSMSGAGKRAAAELEGSHSKMVSSMAGISHSANLATAGIIGLGAAAYGVKKSVDATAELAKETLLLHNVTGLSTKSASAYAGVAQVQGLNAKQLNQAFGTLAKSVQAVSNAHEGLTHAASKQELAFRQLGLPMSAITKAHGDLNKLLPQITKRFEEMPGGIEKTNLGMTLFGRGWQTLVPLMHSGVLGLQEQLKVAKEMGVTLSGNVAQQQKQFIQDQEKMKYATLGLQVAVAQYLAPALGGLIKTIAGAVNEFRKMPEPLKVALEAVAGLSAALLGLVVATKSITAVSTAMKVLKGLFVSTAATAAASEAATATAVTAADGEIVAANTAAGASFVRMLGPIAAVAAAVYALNKILPKGENVESLLGGNQPGEAGREGEAGVSRGRSGAYGRLHGDVGGSIMAYFMSKGLTSAQAAGIVGNAQQESGLNPRAAGGGLFQYIGSRAASGKGGAYEQLEATWRELNGAYKGVLASIKKAKTPEEAARIFSQQFERPGKPELPHREQYAREAYGAHPVHYAVARQAEEAGGNLGYFEPAAQKAHKAHKQLLAHVQNYTKWAEQMVGHFPESTGPNRGPELDKLQAEFHTRAAAWCAEFATTAAMMGGANKAVRTASVATIREWAEQGSHGYQRGVSHTPRKGALMMFGNEHVGIVSSVDQRSGTVSVVEGNTSGGHGVTRSTRRISEGDYAMPKYAAKAEEGATQLGLSAKALSGYVKLAETVKHHEETLIAKREAIAQKILTEHEKMRLALIDNIKKWGETIASLKDKMAEFVERAGQAWANLESKAIGDRAKKAHEAIAGGPESATVKRERKEGEAEADRQTEEDLNTSLTRAKKNLKEVKATGDKEKTKEAEHEVIRAEEAITRFARDQDIKRRETKIEEENQGVDTAQRIEEESLEQRTRNYEGMLNQQFDALLGQLAKAEISYAAFAAKVNALLPPGMKYAGEGPAGGVIPHEYTEPGGTWVRVGPGKAAGGPVMPGVSYMVGEQGPELFTPSAAGQITPAGKTAELVGAAPPTAKVDIHGGMHVTTRQDMDRWANRIAFRLKHG